MIHGFALTILDKAMIAFSFFIVSVTSVPLEELSPAGTAFTLFSIFVVVGMLYMIVWLIVNILTGWAAGLAQSTWMRLGLAILTFSFIIQWFPIVLSVGFWFMGLKLGLDVETVLTWTLAIRFFVLALLRRRWHQA